MPSATARKHQPAPAAHNSGAAIVTVPLSKLVTSDLNVRRTDREVGIVDLARDISENGLKQNLVVVPQPETGRFEVIAGDRRLQALCWLLHDGKLAHDFPVPVLIEERGTGRQTSLSENLHRVALNPADELFAYRTIIEELEGDEPARIAECARRFAKTVKYVEQRLRLADLHPDIFEALREARISLHVAQAYAGFADQALQLQVFTAEERRSFGPKHDPAEVRRQLQSKSYPSDIPQALYVGLLEYRAAGGRSDRDLFMGLDEGRERLLDTILLDRLAREKAVAELPVRAREDGFHQGVLHFGVSPPPKAPPGFVRSDKIGLDDLPRRQRVKAIGVYALARDGSRLECVGHFYPVEQGGSAAVAATATARREREESAERFATIERNQAIRLHAARLAVSQFTGLPAADKALWPAPEHWLEPIEEELDGTFLVAVQFRVTAEQLEEMKAAAEQALDAELALAAAGDGAGDEA